MEVKYQYFYDVRVQLPPKKTSGTQNFGKQTVPDMVSTMAAKWNKPGPLIPAIAGTEYELIKCNPRRYYNHQISANIYC